jgi:hypothetical protein
MRGSWFRSWLLVLALVIETAAGGAMVAGPMVASDGATVAQHCVNRDREQNSPAGEHKHDCLSCPFCAASVLSAFTLAVTAYALTERPSVALGSPAEFSAPTPLASASAHQPRAPPAFS